MASNIVNPPFPQQSGSAPYFGVRAWVNFNGTGTVAIRASGNVSSITDNGTGDYTVNFAIALPSANYALFMSGEALQFTYDSLTPRTASACRILLTNAAIVATDVPYVSVCVVG